MVYHGQSGLLVVFGGFGYTCTGSSGYVSDTWAFNTSSSEWAWISGSSVDDVSPINYSTLGFQISGAMAVNTDTSAIYMFGGVGSLSEFTLGNVDFVWVTNITTDVISRSSGVASSGTSTRRTQISSSRQLSFSRLISTSSLSSTRSSSYNSASSSMASTFLSSDRQISSDTLPDPTYGSSQLDSFPSLNGLPSLQSFSIIPDASFTVKEFSSQATPILPLTIETVTTSKDLTTDTWTSRSPISIDALSSVKSSRAGATSTSTLLPTITITNSKDSAAESKPVLASIMSIKYPLLAVLLGVLLAVTTCVSVKLLRNRAKIIESPTSDVISTTLSSLQLDDYSTSVTTFSNTGETTLATTSKAVYLPGGLKVDGIVAYRTIRELVRGGGGSVWLATAFDPALNEFGDTVIVKIPNAKQMNERALALFRQEVALMNAFKRCENIAKLLGYAENPYSIILKYYPTGSLSKWINSGHRVLQQAHAFMKDISAGLFLLHTNGVAHCDLKPDNVLIDVGEVRQFAVITDFGISRIVTDKLLKVQAYEIQLVKGASLAYAAPEALEEFRGRQPVRKNPNETTARDIYAIGLILLAVLTGKD
eukprot:Partr_v1_DN28187_c7_g1_i1_m55790